MLARKRLLATLAASAAIAFDNAGLIETLRQHTIELEARNEELDAFAHTVAHDLKNPVGTVWGFAETLEEEHPVLSSEELRDHLNAIARNGRKMANIVDELLLLTGVRKMDVEMVPLNMASVVAEARQRLTDLIQGYQAHIQVPPHWPVALGHAPWVEEVFLAC